jgi:hypothetical protein
MRRRSRRTPRARPSLMDPKQDVRSHPSCPPLPLPTMLRCCAASGRAFYPIQRPTSSSASTSLTTDRHSSSTTIRKVRLLFHPSGSLGPYGFHAAGTKPYPEPANEAAARFVGENELPEVYVDQVRPTTLVQAWYASERDADLHLTGIPVDRSRSPRFCGRMCRLRVRRRRLRSRRAALQVRTQPASARRSQPG